MRYSDGGRRQSRTKDDRLVDSRKYQNGFVVDGSQWARAQCPVIVCRFQWTSPVPTLDINYRTPFLSDSIQSSKTPNRSRKTIYPVLKTPFPVGKSPSRVTKFPSRTGTCICPLPTSKTTQETSPGRASEFRHDNNFYSKVWRQKSSFVVISKNWRIS